MISLIPSYARHYDEFWKALRGRNLWFIKLRYIAVAMLLLVLFFSEFVLSIRFSPAQYEAILIITAIILLYNILLHFIRKFVVPKADRFNPIHLSFIQMLLDITALFLLVYFTGSIESPMFLLFVFHMIIGSLILPGIIVYFIAACIVVVFTTIVILEYNGILYHHFVSGFLTYPVYSDFNYIISFTVFFAFLIFVSVLLTNKIARQLYSNEQKLVESIEKLNKAEEEKQKYIIGVVHELKSPIAAVQSYIEMILQKYLGPLNEKVEMKLSAARERADEAIEMINNILKISRLRLMSEISMESIDVKEIVCSTLEKQKAGIEAKKITVKMTDDRLLRTPVRGDKFLLEMAVSNIISNAVKYVNTNGLIDISISEIEDGICLDISDNGVGIPLKDQENIFRDFYRASNIKNKGYEGVGLGLSIVKQIIERHGGKITVESPGRIGNHETPGSGFVIFLPY
jgi:signal transduction histidine kinase